MNTRLLRKVQKHILAVPERLDMERFCQHMDPNRVEAPPCGTVACIGGWAHLLSLKRLPKTEAQIIHADEVAYRQSIKKLKLNGDQALRLFADPYHSNYEERTRDFSDVWPKKFGLAYLKAKTAKQQAKVAAARIDHFIKTRGRE